MDTSLVEERAESYIDGLERNFGIVAAAIMERYPGSVLWQKEGCMPSFHWSKKTETQKMLKWLDRVSNRGVTQCDGPAVRTYDHVPVWPLGAWWRVGVSNMMFIARDGATDLCDLRPDVAGCRNHLLKLCALGHDRYHYWFYDGPGADCGTFPHDVNLGSFEEANATCQTRGTNDFISSFTLGQLRCVVAASLTGTQDFLRRLTEVKGYSPLVSFHPNCHHAVTSPARREADARIHAAPRRRPTRWSPQCWSEQLHQATRRRH